MPSYYHPKQWLAVYDPEERYGFSICRPTISIKENDDTCSVLYYQRVDNDNHLLFRSVAYCIIRPEFILGQIHVWRLTHEDIECPELGITIPVSLARLHGSNIQATLTRMNKLIQEKEEELRILFRSKKY